MLLGKSEDTYSLFTTSPRIPWDELSYIGSRTPDQVSHINKSSSSLKKKHFLFQKILKMEDLVGQMGQCKLEDQIKLCKNKDPQRCRVFKMLKILKIWQYLCIFASRSFQGGEQEFTYERRKSRSYPPAQSYCSYNIYLKRC